MTPVMFVLRDGERVVIRFQDKHHARLAAHIANGNPAHYQCAFVIYPRRK